MGIARPRVALLSNGTEPTKGTEDVQAAHALLAEAHDLAFAGNVEGFAVGTGEADVIVADGFTGNVFLKVMEGTADTLLRAVRDAATASLRAKTGGFLLRPVAARAARRDRPRGAGRRVPARPAAAGGRPARLVRGERDRAGDRARGARRARRRGRPDLRPAGRRGRAAAARRDADRHAGAVRPTGYGARSMTRDEVLSYVRAHLADELELDPARVQEGTRFKEDLEADSLDLYSLVQELEDTYGVRMSDDEAARITDRRPGRGLRARERGDPRAEALTPARAPRPAGGAAGRSRPAGGDARLVDGAPRRQLRAARAARRLRARPVGHDAPVPAARRGHLRRGAADEDPRPGGVRPLLPRRGRAARAARAAPGGGAAGGRAADARGAASRPSACSPR